MSKHSESTADRESSDRGLVRVPRWAVFFLAGLLTVLPISCFLLGLAAAQLSRPRQTNNPAKTLCRVTGQLRDAEGAPLPAVVLLLPLSRAPNERLDPTGLNPSSFEPLGNPAILEIQRLGGAVARTTESGTFRLDVEAPERFLLVSISQAGLSEGKKMPQLSRDLTAELVRYFLPLDSLYSGHELRAVRIQANSAELELGTVGFEN